MQHIAYIVDSLTWVQAQRAKDLQPYLPDHALVVMEVGGVDVWGLLVDESYDAVWLASWRILLAHPELENILPLERTLASVTSHYNIGGGLKPETCFRKGTDPAEEFAKAIATLKRFRAVTCNSKILYDLLSPHLPDVILAQNGVDADFFAPRAECPVLGSIPTVGWVGKDKGAKNIAAFLAASQALDGVRANFYAIVPKKRRGPVKDREGMREFYRKCDYLVCTSWHEGTPNPALEAAACGLPLITTPVGNMPELVREGETGWFIEPTAESLIACVERLEYLEPWEYRRMSEAIRADILRDWTWEKRIPAYQRALEAVCSV